jgi:cytochrome b6-f complex iron-sulfur subunit
VLFEPSPIFKAGKPEDYTVGEVSTKWVKDERVWIVRESEGIYAILANCTHLGCTPKWLASESKYKCPCHGSGFTMQGINFEGPAPRPLERLKIEIAPDGQIKVDKSKKFLFEKGEWGKPGSIIKV